MNSVFKSLNAYVLCDYMLDLTYSLLSKCCSLLRYRLSLFYSSYQKYKHKVHHNIPLLSFLFLCMISIYSISILNKFVLGNFSDCSTIYSFRWNWFLCCFLALDFFMSLGIFDCSYFWGSFPIVSHPSHMHP